MANLHKAGDILPLHDEWDSTVKICYGKICFSWGTFCWKFCTYHSIFDLRKTLLIIIPLHLQIVVMEISAHADNHKYRKSIGTKIYHLYHLFGIIYKSIFCQLEHHFNYWFISETINIRSNFIWKCPLSHWYPCSDKVYHFSQ